MSQLTIEQQEKLSYIWHDLHEKGKTSEALFEAEAEWQTIFESPVSDYHRELAVMIVTFAKSLAKHATDANSLKNHVSVALRNSLDNFPLSNDVNQAIEKGNTWDTVYGPVSAQKEVARHLFQLTQLISYIQNDSDLQSLSSGLWMVLTEKKDDSDERKNRALLIHQIETENVETAFTAYENFLRSFGSKAEVEQITEMIVVSSVLIGRLVDQGKVVKLIRPLEILTKIFATRPDLQKFIIKTGVEHFSEKLKNVRLKIKMQSLMKGQKFSPEFEALLDEFKKQRFIGMGNNSVANIRTGETNSFTSP